MAVFTLTLVRHGETVENKDQVIQGQLDTKLSEIGEQQAALIAQRLQYDKFSHIFCSDLRRASRTCEVIKEQNKVSNRELTRDPRLRERAYGIFEGKSKTYYLTTLKKAKKLSTEYTPPGGESLQQLRARAVDFFRDLCTQLRQLIGSQHDGNTCDNPMDVNPTRRHNAASFSSSNGSPSGNFVFGESCCDASLMGAQQGLVPTEPCCTIVPEVTHTNSGSTSSSGCSSMTADGNPDAPDTLNLPGCPAPCKDSPVDGNVRCVTDLGSPLSEPSPSLESVSSFEDDYGRGGIGEPVFDANIRTTIVAPKTADHGCPNVSLSPIFEHRLPSISSVSSGRNSSFDDGEIPLLLAEVLVVSHGGFLKELFCHFVDDLGCKIPGGRGYALQVSPNTGLSKFTVSISSGEEPPRLTCLSIHDKDHLMYIDMQPVGKSVQPQNV